MEERKIGTDSSFYAENVDYSQMAPNVDFTIIRAGQGSWIDNYFEKNRSAAKGIIPRGAYWFYDDRYKPVNQATLFAEMIGDDLMELPLWCDYELDHDGAQYGDWTHFHTFLRELERLLPDKQLGIYTGYYYWRDHVQSSAYQYFEKYPLWLASYNSLENVLVPEPWKSNEGMTLWQYTESGDGKLYGLDPLVKKAIDLNYYMGNNWAEFSGGVMLDEPESVWVSSIVGISKAGEAELDTTPFSDVRVEFSDGTSNVYALSLAPESPPAVIPDPPTVVDYPYDGVERKKEGTTQVLTISDFDSFAVLSPGGCLTVDKLGYDVACNGTGFEWGTCVANQTVKIGGVLISEQHDYEPYAYWVNKKLNFSESLRTLKSVDNALAIRRYLVIGGVQNPNPSSAWDELHKWQLIGSGANGETIIISVMDEVNLYEAARVMMENGVINGGDLDSGGSVQTKVGNDIMTAEGRAVSNFIGFTFINENIPTDPPVIPPVGTVAQGINLSVRRGASTSAEKIASLPSGTKIEIDSIISGDTYDWAKWSVYSAVKKNDGSKNYLDMDTPVPEPEPPSGEHRAYWKSDPERPDNLYYTRDSGYKKVSVMSEKGKGSEVIAPEYSAIFLGDKIEGDYLHVVDQNGVRVSGWINYKTRGMIPLVKIPDDVLNSLIPPQTKTPEIFRYIEAPDDGEVYRQFVWAEHKEEHAQPQPHTVNLYRDNPSNGFHGWLPLSRPWQFFIFDLMKLDAPGNDIIYYISAYCNLVSDNRCFTDLHFKDDHTDFVLGQNLALNKPYYWKVSITTRGNYIKQLSQDGNNIYVDGLDVNSTPPKPEDVYNNHSLIHKANVAYPNEKKYILSNGHVKTVFFPMIKQMINGKMEKTGTSYPFFRVPHPVNRNDARLEVFPPNEKRTIVNLSRWL